VWLVSHAIPDPPFAIDVEVIALLNGWQPKSMESYRRIGTYAIRGSSAKLHAIPEQRRSVAELGLTAWSPYGIVRPNATLRLGSVRRLPLDLLIQADKS
jgi:hypothetical protein